ncbi:hypothetical protein NONI108955_42705 [Nocardia ninae]|uniref:Uncharacterized protein n=1 Tax=Nocardia ninae NBRC 108245 TaxID=1210091 RepID=A0A511MTC9_9NOCA|nr:hypothetical protein [Nocardia ninae]GEM43843.1 hypothetical protein NN4_83620 [Nocardia ninae NBRC 108245]
MEHGQEAGESIGAMLSSIAAVLREVSDKLDAVAARVDGVDIATATVVPADRSVEARLAKLEAWAFRAGQDISGIDGRLEKVEAGGGPSHAAPDSERAERPLPRAASRRNAAATEPNAPAQRESPATVATPTIRESIGTSHELAQPVRDSTLAARENATATRESVSRRYEGSPTARDTPPARDSAAHEANSVPQRSFSAPREPAFEPSSSAAQNFTTPTPREPSPVPAQNFTAPTPREPLPVRQSSFTAPREPAASSSYQNFTTPQENPYESMVPSAPDSSDYSRPTNGTAPEANGTALTGAHRADDDLIPVDNTHVDKLQAMLDELKKTAAAPLGRSDVFGPPAGDLNSTSYQPAGSETRSTDTPRDYRLSSPPPVS